MKKRTREGQCKKTVPQTISRRKMIQTLLGPFLIIDLIPLVLDYTDPVVGEWVESFPSPIKLPRSIGFDQDTGLWVLSAWNVLLGTFRLHHVYAFCWYQKELYIICKELLDSVVRVYNTRGDKIRERVLSCSHAPDIWVDQKEIFLLHNPHNRRQKRIQVLDCLTLETIRELDLDFLANVGSYWNGVSVSDQTIYLMDGRGGDAVLFVDRQTGEVASQRRVDNTANLLYAATPRALEIGGGSLFVCGDKIIRVDLEDRVQVVNATRKIGFADICFDGQFLYAIGFDDNTIHIFR